ncbi:hypothetical protein J4413_03635 [Candidatus Woesearchaeota archaeon]|nr:hypothetical protein [Candidatus Woesearchaeota archaeon]
MTKAIREAYTRVKREEDFVSSKKRLLLYDLYFIIDGCVSEPILEGTILSDFRIGLLEVSIRSGIVYYKRGD